MEAADVQTAITEAEKWIQETLIDLEDELGCKIDQVGVGI